MDENISSIIISNEKRYRDQKRDQNGRGTKKRGRMKSTERK